MILFANKSLLRKAIYMIAQILNAELNRLHNQLGQNQNGLLVLTGKLGSGKVLLLKLIEKQISSSEKNSATLYYQLHPAIGLTPQLINLESCILDLEIYETKKVNLEQASLTGFLRTKLDFDQPVITGSPLTAEDTSKMFKNSIEAASKNLGSRKLYLLIDLTETNNSRYDEFFVKLFSDYKYNNIQAIIATSEFFHQAHIGKKAEYFYLNSTDYLTRSESVEDKLLLNETVLQIWKNYQGNLLVMDSLTRFAQAFGIDSLENGLEKVVHASDLDTFMDLISAKIFSQSGAAEQMLLMGLACSLQPLTKIELMKAINWDADYLERVLKERSRITALLDNEAHQQNKLAIFNSSIRQGVLKVALRGQIRPIHKRLTKNYLHRDLSDYWQHPKDLTIAIYHLRASESPEIINFLLLTEAKALSRLWGLTDIMLDSLKFAIEQVKSYKPSSISFEVVASKEHLDFQIGEVVKSAEYSLYREYAYFLEINGQASEGANAWEKSLAAVDSSTVDAAMNARFKAMVWADIAQLRFENGKLSEAVDALQKQVQYIRKAKINGKMLTAASHNLGLIQLSSDNFSEARKAFEQALSASEKPSLQAAEEIIQIAHTWRLADNSDKASASYQEVANMTEALGEKGSYFQAIALGYLALGQLEQGNLNTAYDSTQKARSLFKLVGASNDEEMADQLLQEIQRAQKESR